MYESRLGCLAKQCKCTCERSFVTGGLNCKEAKHVLSFPMFPCFQTSVYLIVAQVQSDGGGQADGCEENCSSRCHKRACQSWGSAQRISWPVSWPVGFTQSCWKSWEAHQSTQHNTTQHTAPRLAAAAQCQHQAQQPRRATLRPDCGKKAWSHSRMTALGQPTNTSFPNIGQKS